MTFNRKILVVDDEPEALRGYETFLASSGGSKKRQSSRSKTAASTNEKETFELIKASTGEEAVDLARKAFDAGEPCAAGFFDVKLGDGIDGLQAIKTILGFDPDIHCVVVTAYQDRSVDEIHHLFGEAFKDHWDYLNKPFTQGEIVQKARQMVTAWNRKKELQEMHSHLVQSERMASIGQVARGIGHEFGNILLRIMGKADLALQESDLEKIKKHLEVILQASERAGIIVRNLQSFSKSKPDVRLTSIETVLEEALSLINHEMVKTSATARKNFQSCPEIQMDTGSMVQVVLNIMINALHAMAGKKGGILTLETKPEKDGIQCDIADTGSGIDPDILDKIFQYAFSTKGDSGSGLGLSLSKEIVEAHGGTISVTSVPDKGSRFQIWLPLQKSTEDK